MTQKYSKFSVIIAAYNEEATIAEVIRRVRAATVPGLEQEIVVVDDGSKDRTAEILRGIPGIVALFHERNLGKGGALRTGIAHATGDILLLQDADLEYNPEDYPVLVRPIIEGRTELVLGSRFLYRGPRFFTRNGDPFFSHYVGNKLIVGITNLLYGQKVSDYEGCYKAFTRDLRQRVNVHANGFEFDNELICKSLRLGYRLTEVPIQYRPRLYSEGKKISWRDGLRMLWTIVKWRFLPV
ncbi:MAG TPA: glycosyltransferase family 2 protein [Candidatus Omnitrophota bacterium]|nr:glycosyltransferase family 2 protein [Candidatus Omnitrophota bacterium]HPS37312.1 glycosyltransferase family 2 protein [Candidatus Omnitrophota bacterium]